MAHGKGTGKQSGTKMVVWGILGLLIIGLGGFGTANFGGGVTRVARVGDEDITPTAYANALQTQIRAIESQTGQDITVQQALSFGLSQQVLGQLLDQAALDNETAKIGISVGDDAVRRELLAMDAFKGFDGTFSTETYKDMLARNNLDGKTFEAGLRKDAARAILTGALATGITMPPSYGQVVVDWLGERRTISVATLTVADLETGTPIASDADIQAWYDAHPDAYTAPEARKVTYAWLTPAMLTDEVELDEDALRKLYDDNITSYVQPERRLVERLVYGSEEDAKAAAERITSGETSFEDEVTTRGLDLIDVDMGDVSADDLSSDAATVVFALEGTGVVGPVMSDLGPALYRVNGTLAGTEISFEEARDDLAVEMAADAAARLIADQIETFDNDLADGMTLENLAEATQMELGTMDWTPESEGGIAAYTAFKDAVATLSPDDYPAIMELGDGGVFAMRLDAIVPSAVRPLDEVRDQVSADWERDAIATLLTTRAEALETDVAAGTPITELGLASESFEAITRQGNIASMPAGFIDAVFAPGLTLGGTTLIPGQGRVVIAKIDKVDAPAKTDENSAIADGYITSAAQGAAQDVIAAFSNALRLREGVTVNEPALNAVHSQIQ
ncbi:MAG: SurA N-terminal domain-containing protein [Alphaproteobacteria bacterium]|nr:SurA N-terminal domain-containing protein [Alphaproteobacteria bacterium]MBU1277552.1 SurA N-terminal domain-containing protein [Alphaproteobacteria bacterium]MBU1574323.1 SurA N-terminal domain-containing protein [Alphaproteobacteria bacterium]MBU1830913.1 SurA N-terminal domain-containing protein [Alphaproteobacteria bacterium]MBU2076866.1 SurA N-terminal domain-containing protein [Alphaproteobacteria bacterium]